MLQIHQSLKFYVEALICTQVRNRSSLYVVQYYELITCSLHVPAPTVPSLLVHMGTTLVLLGLFHTGWKQAEHTYQTQWRS